MCLLGTWLLNFIHLKLSKMFQWLSIDKDHESSIVPNATGVSPGEGTGATMSDDDDDDQVDSETNLLDGSLDVPDSMGFGPLVPTDSERSLMERVRQELKHELKQVKCLSIFGSSIVHVYVC